MSAGSPNSDKPKPAGLSNLQQRIVSGIVLIVGVLLLTWAGGVWYRLLCAAIAAGVLYEWTAMTLPGGAHPAHRTLLAGLLAILLVLLVWGSSAGVLLLVLAAAVLAAAAHAAIAKTGFWAVAGLAYAGLCGVSLAFLRGGDTAGLITTLFLFAIVWSTDIMAYFVGRSVGGPKLAPSISPGKTWSGAVGGTVAAVIAGIAVASYAGSPLGLGTIITLVIALSVVSQAGDLFESRLKRLFSVKDSSQLIPGHGGVMDRVDGLAAAAFVLFAIGALLAGLDTPAHAFFNR